MDNYGKWLGIKSTKTVVSSLAKFSADHTRRSRRDLWNREPLFEEEQS